MEKKEAFLLIILGLGLLANFALDLHRGFIVGEQNQILGELNEVDKDFADVFEFLGEINKEIIEKHNNLAEQFEDSKPKPALSSSDIIMGSSSSEDMNLTIRSGYLFLTDYKFYELGNGIYATEYLQYYPADSNKVYYSVWIDPEQLTEKEFEILSKEEVFMGFSVVAIDPERFEEKQDNTKRRDLND